MYLYFKKLIFKVFNKIRFYKGYIKEHFLSKYIVIKPNEIFLQQNYPCPYINLLRGGYNRLDVVVRYLAIENYYGKNNFGFNLYAKMQDERIKRGYSKKSIDSFKMLIKSYDENGYDKKSYITLDKNLCLMDGSHRLALSLYHNISDLNCRIMPIKHEPYYGIRWFLEHGFKSEDIDCILSKCDEIITSNPVDITVVLWPPVNTWFDEIEKNIRNMYSVKSSRDYEFDTDEKFSMFVKHIYESDDIADWKIEKKIKGMIRYPHLIRVIKVDFIYPHFRIKGNFSHTLSEEGEFLKKYIRNIYKGQINNYFEDIIIHATDNSSQSAIVSKFLNDMNSD